jgi:hypothetical protein
MNRTERTRRIAELNDALRIRAGLPSLNGLGSRPTGLIVLTRGVIELPVDAMMAICQRVRTFSDFNEENDPYREHDFGMFFINPVGYVYWKIDYYADSSCRFGSEDPSDPEASFRVLTIMLAEEY